MIVSSLPHRISFVGALLGTLSLAACGDFAHTNPLDRQASVAVELTGPDSAFSYRDTLSFVAHTLPSYTPEQVAWSAFGQLAFIPIGNGTFFVHENQYTTVAVETLRVEVDGRVAKHVLHFAHRAAAVKGGECVSQARTFTLDSFGRQASFCLRGSDAHGYAAPLGAMPTVSVSDTSVISATPIVDGASVHALQNGTSVVRMSVRGMTDSVTVIVRQRIDRVFLDPAACQDYGSGVILYVGDSVQVSPTSHATDPGGAVIADTARVRAAVRGMTFGLGLIHYGVKVSPTGMVTALDATAWPAEVAGQATTPEEGTVGGTCYFRVRYR